VLSLSILYFEKNLIDTKFFVSTATAKKIIDDSLEESEKSLIKAVCENHYKALGFQVEVQGIGTANRVHVDVNCVQNDILNKDDYKRLYANSNACFIDDIIDCEWELEKMSKSKLNVVNPDDIINEYGADTLRMYEMFLGPLEQSKPWNTNGISGVHNFLRRYWRLTHTDAGFAVSDDAATKAELKILHKTIKKVQDDIERFSFNTAVSSFMICVNELSDLKCNKRAVIEPLTALLSPFAPHIAEEVWKKLGHDESVINAAFPAYNAEYTVDDAFAYPIQFNGKMKFNVEVPLNISKEEIEKLILADEKVLKQLAGAAPKKVIVVPGKIVNIVA
jgi:leucyl-tRNA synthetase